MTALQEERLRSLAAAVVASSDSIERHRLIVDLLVALGAVHDTPHARAIWRRI